MNEFHATLDDGGSESNFGDLVARLRTQGGANLSAELSVELALDIVLNEIADQARLATGASGAAIVLQHYGEMVCRARSGTMAPELGARLNGSSGISGECFRTRQTQRSDDVLEDSRADIEVSRRLGVRSVMVAPLLRGAELVGVFELFSSLPAAFVDRDEQTLELLARKTLRTVECATEERNQEERRQLEKESKSSAVPEPVLSSFARVNSAGRRYDFGTWMLGISALVCAILFGMAVGRQLSSHREPKAGGLRGPASPPSSAPSTSVTEANPAASSTGQASNAPAEAPVAAPKASQTVPLGGLLVLENGKEVFRLPPAKNQGQGHVRQEGGVHPAASIEPANGAAISPAVDEDILLYRVEPEYPEEARQQKIQGLVVLQVHVGSDGAVQDVQVVSGPAALVEAATDAVKQWQFKPRLQNGRPTEMVSKVSLNFRLQD